MPPVVPWMLAVVALGAVAWAWPLSIAVRASFREGRGAFAVAVTAPVSIRLWRRDAPGVAGTAGRAAGAGRFVAALRPGRDARADRPRRAAVPAAVRLWTRYRRWLDGLRDVLLYLGRRGRCTRLRWHTVVGAGDAAATAWACGAVWAAKGAGLALARRALRLGPVRPQVAVRADFSRAVVESDLDCIFEVPLGDIITAALRGVIAGRA